jgi:hypothetical protein
MEKGGAIMKLIEAKMIQSMMINWVMFNMGISETQPERLTFSLSEMLKANEAIEKFNKSNIGKSGRRKVYMTIDERMIAALYVASNFSAKDETEPIACANGNYLYVIKSEQEVRQ